MKENDFNHAEKKGLNGKKKLIIFWILISILIVSILTIGSLLFDWFWVIGFPMSFLLVIAFQSLSEHFLEVKIPCPNCGMGVKESAHRCKACGFQLQQECPDCGSFVPRDEKNCEGCGHEFNEKS